MNIQAQLLELAEKHENNPGVSALVKTIRENQGTVLGSLAVMSSACDNYAKAAIYRDGFVIPRDTATLVQNAALASNCMAVMASAFFDLSTVLQALGEDVSFY